MKARYCLFLPLVVTSVMATAQKPNTLTRKEKKEGWTLLFDGTSTKGWHTYLRDTVGSKWQVKDGALVFDPTQPRDGGGDIVTNNEYENYELTLEWKISKGGNSGIIFDVQEDPQYKATYMTGPEMQVLDNIDADDNKKENHLAGCLYDMAGDAQVSKPKPVGEWNQVRLIQNKGHLTFWLNGIKTFEGQMGSDEWNKLIQNSKFKSWKAFATYPKGHIALQDHGAVVAFRDIRLKQL